MVKDVKGSKGKFEKIFCNPTYIQPNLPYYLTIYDYTIMHIMLLTVEDPAKTIKHIKNEKKNSARPPPRTGHGAVEDEPP